MNAIEIYENAIRMFELNGEITLGEFEDMIKPLEDVAPVVHGEWVYNKTSQLWECSNCHEAEIRSTTYCPHCGSRNRGGR